MTSCKRFFFSTLETEHTNTREEKNMQECAPRMISFEFLMNLTYILSNKISQPYVQCIFLPEHVSMFAKRCESFKKGIMMKCLREMIK